jgi:hypothetical protein
MPDCFVSLAEDLVKEADSIFGLGRIGAPLGGLRKDIEGGCGIALPRELFRFDREVEALISRESRADRTRK